MEKVKINLNNYKFAFVPGGIILAAALSLLFVLPSEIKTILREKRVVNKNKKELIDLRQRYALISALDKEEIRAQSTKAVKVLPETKDVTYILTGLRNALERAEFAIDTLQFSPGEIKKEVEEKSRDKKVVESLPINLELIGILNNFDKLLKELETSAPLFEIALVEMSKFTRISEEEVVKVELSLSTFYSPPMTAYKTDVITIDDLVLTEAEKEILTTLDQFTPPQTSGAGVSVPSREPFDNPFEL